MKTPTNAGAPGTAAVSPHLGLFLVATLTLTGCHKQTIARSPSPTATAPTHTQSARAQIPAAKPALPPDDLKGRPISVETGLASWYGPPYSNRKAADGSVFDQNALTAAHRTLPMGTTVRVTNLATGQSVVVRITDRGPFVQGRILDLSLAAAKATGLYRMGVAKVKVEAFAHNTADPGGRWCVQIGAFLDQTDATTLKNDLLRRYAPSKVIEFAGPTGHWVRINPATPDRQHADQIAASIHVPDAEPYVVRTN